MIGGAFEREMVGVQMILQRCQILKPGKNITWVFSKLPFEHRTSSLLWHDVSSWLQGEYHTNELFRCLSAGKTLKCASVHWESDPNHINLGGDFRSAQRGLNSLPPHLQPCLLRSGPRPAVLQLSRPQVQSGILQLLSFRDLQKW